MPDYQERIAHCSRMLVGNSDVSGQGRKINAPLLSIFLGQDAEAHMDDVLNTYQNCWLSNANVLQSLTAQTYSPDNVLNACQAMLSVRNTFNSYSVYLAYYWDIMDDKFDDIFASIQAPLSFPTAVSVEAVFFLFCRELLPGAKARKEKRLKALIQWAEETKHHLVVLSDLTPSGLLGPDEIGENYRLSANILLIANSYFYPGEKELGKPLAFFLNQHPVHSASYFILKKPTWDIAVACLWQILDDYQRLPQSTSHASNVKERLCGQNHSYAHFFENLFQEKIASLLPQDYSFLRYLPYTSALRLNNTAQASVYMFTSTSKDTASVAKGLIEERLYQTYQDSSAYYVMTSAEMMDIMNTMTNTMMVVLVAIAAISLLVGGIGIMNIMLVSVTERTREIGIRKSLGAKRKAIRSQFIIEAGTTSAIGGVLGILLGVGLAGVAGSLISSTMSGGVTFTAVPTVTSVATAFGVSVGIGVLFGYLPANKAAALNPIDALRYE